MEDEKYYLIGFELPQGQYIAAQASADGSSWAMQGHRVPKIEGYYLYNEQGEISGTLPFESGEELARFDEAVSADMLAYNGQSIYFEGDYELVLPDEFSIIP